MFSNNTEVCISAFSGFSNETCGQTCFIFICSPILYSTSSRNTTCELRDVNTSQETFVPRTYLHVASRVKNELYRVPTSTMNSTENIPLC